MARTAPVPNIPPIPGMCPSLAVMGGGGGSGGGSGNSAGTGGNGNGAGGEGGADGTDGDATGSGACGPGSPGDCNNCGTTVAAGDPVDVVSGKVFTSPHRDLYLPGTFALAIMRSYCSASRHADMGMGHGWRYSLGWSVTKKGRKCQLHTGDGRTIDFPDLKPGQMFTAGKWQFARGEHHIAVRPGNEFEHYFDLLRPDEGGRDGDDVFRLRFIRYRERGHIALYYKGAQLSRAVDTVGRSINFAHTDQGRIASISVPSTDGHQLVFARYAYDDRGDLVAVTNANGHAKRFSYDDDHRLVRITHPNGLSFEFVYDQDDRCIETWGSYPQGQDPALADDAKSYLADGGRAAKGIYHYRISYEDDFSEIMDTQGIRRFHFGPDGKVLEAVTASGGVTTRAFDAAGNVTGRTDAEGGTWRWDYDEQGDLVTEIDPDGYTSKLTRDSVGNVVAIADPGGAITRFNRGANGEVVRTEDAVGDTSDISHNANGMIVRVRDERGEIHTRELDTHANVIAHQFPNGSTYRSRYDYWGRLVEKTDGLGNATRYTVSPTSQVLSMVDPLGRSHRYDYDSMGNLSGWTRPDGQAVTYEYGGYNWLCRERFADGTDVSAQYSRQGHLVKVVNEKGEVAKFEHNADGFVSHETSFIGTISRFGYDLLGRMTSYDDGTGKTFQHWSPRGLQTAIEFADGSKADFDYDARGFLVGAAYGANTVQWELDPLGRMLKETITIDSKEYVVDSLRTHGGDRTAVKTNLGLEAHVVRDQVGRTKSLKVAGAQHPINIHRDANAAISRIDLSGTAAIASKRDAAGNLVERFVDKGTTETPGGPQWVGSRVGDLRRNYTYDSLDEIIEISDTEGDDIAYTYDLRRRLTGIRKNGTNHSSYRYDQAGNSVRTTPDPETRQYEVGSQLRSRDTVEYEYDVAGNLAAKTDSNGRTSYRYNGLGLLSVVELPDERRISYTYDAFARRLTKTVGQKDGESKTVHFVWDQTSMVHEVDAVDTEHITTYVFEDTNALVPLAMKKGNDLQFVVAEPNGRPHRLVGSDGNDIVEIEADTFGAPKGSPPLPFGFPGQQFDSETGLHYNRYRYFDPASRRYTTPDPIGIDGGLNLYQYGPNPVAWIDPLGLVRHEMGVQSSGSQIGSSARTRHSNADGSYSSGWSNARGGTPRCPRRLRNEANSHTEQKFADDLLRSHRAGRRRGEGNIHAGDRHQLSGQLPPCPTCHVALTRAAAETGAHIEYQWGDGNSVVYDGGSASGRTVGDRMSQIAGNQSAYTGDATTLRDNGYSTVSSSDARWGYSAGSGSQEAYRDMT